MKLEGRIYRQNRALCEAVVDLPDPGGLRYVELLDRALVALCKEMDIPLPIWLQKNTVEFARFRQTIFFSGQFTETVKFDRFQIRLL